MKHGNDVRAFRSNGARAPSRACWQKRLTRSHRPQRQLRIRHPDPRCIAYRALFTEAIGDEQLAEIRAHVQQQRALGNDRFQRLIKAELGRCARVRPPIGRVAIPGWRQNKVF